MGNYVSLHNHGTYSLLDGRGNPEEVMEIAAKIGYSAIGVTDHDGVYALPFFADLGKKQKIRAILGIEIRTVPNVAEKQRHKNHLTVLTHSVEGYKNLMKMVSKSYSKEIFYYKPNIDFNILKEHYKGLTILSGCIASELSSYILNRDNTYGSEQESLVLACKYVKKMKEQFGNKFYLEIMPHDMEATPKIAQTLRALGKKYDIPLVMTNDVHCLEKGQENIWRLLTAISRREVVANIEPMLTSCYYMNDDEIFAQAREVLGNYFDDDELYKMITITGDIAADCGDIVIPKAENVKTGYADPKAEVRRRCLAGMERFGVRNDTYIERMETELDLINRKGFSDYFIVVSDTVGWAKEKSILVGDGRGSSSCSLVCFLTGITSVDPIRYDLVMERFLSEDRIDPPDIDTDYEDSKRFAVIQHIQEQFGGDKVAHLATFIRFKGRNSLGEVGKAFGIPRADVETVQSLLVDRGRADARKSFTIEDTFTEFKAAKAIAEKYPDILQAMTLEGQIRHIGVHASGVVVASIPLLDSTAMIEKEDDEGNKVFTACVDNDSAHLLGLLKIDILGLKTLSVIKDMLDDTGLEASHLQFIELEDEDVLYKFGNDAKGVFQFGATATSSIAKQVGVANFDDVIATIALPRPGPLHSGCTQLFAEHKNKGTRKVWDLPLMNEITAPTYGLIVFQEQVLRVMKEVGDMSWQEVAAIRNAMSKSLGDEFFNKYREIFIKGAVAKHGVTKEYANETFDYTSTFGCVAWNTRIKTENKLSASVNYDLRFSIGDIDKGLELIKRDGAVELWRNINTNNFQIAYQEGYGTWKVLRSGVGNKRVYKLYEEICNNNKYENIEDIYKRHISGEKVTIPTIDIVTGKIAYKEPVAIVNSGTKRTFFIRTRRKLNWPNETGFRLRTIRCTSDHKFMCEDGNWRKLSDLNIGDKVYVSTAFGSKDYKHYSSTILNKEEHRKRLLTDEGLVWNRGLRASEDIRVFNNVMSSLDSRLHNGNINSWGYGEHSVARDGHICQSGFEAKFEEWLIANDITHIPHPRINGTIRIADYLIGENYVELDGMCPRRTDEYWENKYDSDLSRTIIIRDGDSFEKIKDKLLACADPTPFIDSDLHFEEVIEIKYACEESTFDIIMNPDQPNFIADGFIVHNSWAFNKAHAVGYALLSYYTAYFKTVYPQIFFKTMCNYESGEELNALLREYIEHGYGKVLSPKIGKSGLSWEVEGKDLRPGLLSVLPENAAKTIVGMYPIAGPDDLLERAERRKVNKRIWDKINEYKLFDDSAELDPFGLYVFAKRMSYVKNRTHKIAELGYSFQTRNVCIAGMLNDQINLKSVTELQQSVKLSDWRQRFDTKYGDAWCLPKGTKIVTSLYKGNQFTGVKSCSKDISELKIGDEVISYDEVTGEKILDKVVAVSSRYANNLFELEFSNGNNLNATGEHPVYVVDQGWVRTDQLKIGDKVIQLLYPTLAQRLNWRKVSKKLWQDENYKNNMVASVVTSNKNRIGEIGENKGKAVAARWLNLEDKLNSEERSRKVSFGNKKENNPEHALHISEAKKKQWEDPEFAHKMLHSQFKKQNKSEIYLENKLKEWFPNEWLFTGDRKVWFERCNPDFINSNGKKKIIEFLGCFWHNCEKCGYGNEEYQKLELNSEEFRRETFAKYGYETLYVWGHELDNESALKSKIEKYLYNPNVDIVEITNITKFSNTVRVYNAQIEKNNNFFANGVLTHNCILYMIDETGVQMQCLPAGTKVSAMKDGRSSTKNIEDIIVNDKVLTYDEHTGLKEFEKVVAISNRKTNSLIKLTMSNGNVLKLTDEHPIYVHSKGWVEAKNLNIGDKVIQLNYEGLSLRLGNLDRQGRTDAEILGDGAAKNKHNKISLAVRGKNNFWWHKEIPGETRAKISNTNKITFNTPERKALAAEYGRKGSQKFWEDPNNHILMGERHKEYFANNPDKAIKQGKILVEGLSKVTRERHSEWTKKYWDSLTPEEKWKRLDKLVHSGKGSVPNKSELLLGKYLDEVCPGEFAYNGGGQIRNFDGKRPDYININGKKKAIEAFGIFWHGKEWTGFTREEAEKTRKDFLATFGYDTLILWQDELPNEEETKQKILNFLYNSNTVVVEIVKKEIIPGDICVYNIETEKNHNYFAYGILVHNCHVKNYLYPKYKDMLWSKKVKEDLLIIKGIMPGNTNHVIAKEIYEFNDRKVPGANCGACSLMNAICIGSDGNKEAKLMLVGEASGATEAKEGIPFVGKAGQKLMEIMASVGLKRENVLLDNTIRCWPTDENGKNRTPTDIEVVACKDSLLARIKEVPGRVVVALGATAYHAITGRLDAISSVVGMRIDCDGFTVIPAFHPAACLYSGSEGREESIRNSLRKAHALLGSGESVKLGELVGVK